jgi:glycosyltransferase involved in cell wall biosynthesis
VTATDISVVIPAYNAASFIVEALDAICAQSVAPQEIIVVDDKSSDDTAAVVERHAARCSLPILLLCREANSGGPARPLNEGIALARCPLIAINEHDDLMMPDRLEKQRWCFRRAPHVGLVSCYATIENYECGKPAAYNTSMDLQSLSARPLGNSCYLIPATAVFAELIRSQNWFLRSLSGCLLPKAVWAALGGFNETLRIAADADFILRMLGRYDLAVVADWLYRYRLFANHLYLSAGVDAKQEYATIYRNLLRHPCGKLRESVRSRLRNELQGVAYELRRRGRLRASANAYGRYILSGGSIGHAISGLCKIAVASVTHKSRREVRV